MSDRLAVMDNGNVAQVGAPTEVYEQPATAYVADFLGVANLIAASGEVGHGGRRRVHLGEFTLDAAGDGPAGPVKLVIRPERVRVTAGEAAGPNCLPGMVERVVYVGATTQVHVRLPGGEALQALTANHEGRPDWPAGTAVGVTVAGRRAARPAGLTLTAANRTASRRSRRGRGRSTRSRGARRSRSPWCWRHPHRGGHRGRHGGGGRRAGCPPTGGRPPDPGGAGAGRCGGAPGTRRAPSSGVGGGWWIHLCSSSSGVRSPDAGGSGYRCAEVRPPPLLTRRLERRRVRGAEDVAGDAGGVDRHEGEVRLEHQVGPDPDRAQQVRVVVEPARVRAGVPGQPADLVQRRTVLGHRRADRDLVHDRRPQMSRRARSSTADPRPPRRNILSATTANTIATVVPTSIAVASALRAGVGEPRTLE